MILLAAILATKISTAQLQLYVLDGGSATIRAFDLMSDVENPSSKPVQLADPCFLIKHGTQWLLWDTGLPDSLVGHPQNSPVVALSKNSTMADQLAKLHLKPENIDYVAFSHLHFDHTGTANLFGKANWILQRRELNYSLEKPSPFSVVPGSFDAYNHAKTTIIDSDYDVFGDGTVKILRTPGHTPGHCCLLVRLKSRPIILSGDLFHTRSNYEEGHVPSINWSRAETLASIDRVKTILTNLRARLIVQHDPTDFESLPKPPNCLQ